MCSAPSQGHSVSTQPGCLITADTARYPAACRRARQRPAGSARRASVHRPRCTARPDEYTGLAHQKSRNESTCRIHRQVGALSDTRREAGLTSSFLTQMPFIGPATSRRLERRRSRVVDDNKLSPSPRFRSRDGKETYDLARRRRRVQTTTLFHVRHCGPPVTKPRRVPCWGNEWANMPNRFQPIST